MATLNTSDRDTTPAAAETLAAAGTVAAAETLATAETVARHSRGKLVAFLAMRCGDVAAAEDALSEAFAAALSTWPTKGCPANPEAWLLTVARRKLIDQIRTRHDGPGSDELEAMAETLSAVAEDDIPDRRLALLFACAHPAIDPAIHSPLMLQVVLGLDAAQIASAFLLSPAAIAQRLVRAKAKIRHAGIPFRIPNRDELPERLEMVLDAIYASFAEGWIDAAGSDIARRELASEAIYLAHLLTRMLPDEPEVWGLLALMLYAEARRPARRSAEGEFVPLARQDTALWDAAMIEQAEAALRHASGAGLIGRYQLEAAIQSAHVERRRTGSVAWSAILSLYDALVTLTASPVASINRALALAECEGPMAGLNALTEVSGDSRIATYQPYWAARAELLARTGAHSEARQAYEIAIGLERDPAVKRYLEQRQAKLRI
jgi:RNA polymerase sigma-70 factor (ECF subfamily)